MPAIRIASSFQFRLVLQIDGCFTSIAQRELRALLETVGPEVCDELLAEAAADP